MPSTSVTNKSILFFVLFKMLIYTPPPKNSSAFHNYVL